MTAAEYRGIREWLGLTHTDMGKLFDVNEKQSRRWASGEAPVPAPVAMLLDLVLSGVISKRRLTAKLFEVE